MPDDTHNSSIDRFYKKSIAGRDRNLFLRVEDLEEAMRALKSGSPISVTTIQNIVENEWEFIRSAVAGGTSDPTDPTFTGVVISHSGQMLGGVLYHFALVENGVVLTGLGADVNNTFVSMVDPEGVQRSWFFS